jgi:hypothetical protein
LRTRVRVSFGNGFGKSGLKAAFPKLSLCAFWESLERKKNTLANSIVIAILLEMVSVTFFSESRPLHSIITGFQAEVKLKWCQSQHHKLRSRIV